MIFVALTFCFCVCVRDKWMNDSQRNQEITKSLNNSNSNSKGMTIVTWSKTMAKNSLCWTSPTPLLNPHKNTFFSLNKKWWCWRWWFSYLFMPSFHLCLCLCIIFHFTCIDQMCFLLLSCVWRNDDGSKRRKKELHSPNQSVAIISGDCLGEFKHRAPIWYRHHHLVSMTFALFWYAPYSINNRGKQRKHILPSQRITTEKDSFFHLEEPLCTRLFSLVCLFVILSERDFSSLFFILSVYFLYGCFDYLGLFITKGHTNTTIVLHVHTNDLESLSSIMSSWFVDQIDVNEVMTMFSKPNKRKFRENCIHQNISSCR